MNECVHLLNSAWCADCNGTAAQAKKEEEAERARILTLEGWFPSRYAGVCAECGAPFPAGEPIRRSGQFETKSGKPYVAACCAPAGDPA